jgi:hypothetical protein
MSQNNQQLSGRTSNYRFDRGGKPAEMGPFIGTVMNNVDPTRTGRLQVRITQFASGPDDNPQLWRWVNYLPPFYGVTEKTSSSAGVGSYPGNQQSYGMWFTPPDIGTQVMCFFVEGDPSQGYYMGCIINNALNHMLPAIGAAPVGEYVTGNKSQAEYFADAPTLPVTEINSANSNIDGSPKFYDQQKPVHSYQAAIMFQQGLANDPERGPIISNAQRESPSTVYGVSTPGLPIYSGGLDRNTIRKQLNERTLNPQDVNVIGRLGGHTLVMDDGDVEGKNALFRLRTSKGHQIMMNDTENFFYIVHANGQTWIELGQEGTVDIYSTNSVNVRTQGTINLHADKDINMFAGGNLNLKSNAATNIGAVTTLNMASEGDMTIYSQTTVGVLSDGTIALQSQSGGSWNGGAGLKLQADRIDLNGAGAASVTKPRLYPKTTLDDTTFDNSTGWKVKPNALESIVTRAPTHEPYPFHNKGVAASVNLTDGVPTPPPAATPVAQNVSIIKVASGT